MREFLDRVPEPESQARLPLAAEDGRPGRDASQREGSFLTVLLADAKAFACLRTQPEGPVRLSLADGRLLFTLRETARLMNVEFTDYLIAKPDGRGCYSWREQEKHVG